MNNEEKVTEQDLAYVENLVKRFLAHPETVFLYRGENKTNQNGLHFTADKEWAKNFGGQILRGRLPIKSRIKVLTTKDFDEAWSNGISSELDLWHYYFDQGYDAVLGTDLMADKQIDVIINPKHLKNFKPLIN
jgi:hypothetical protein